MRMARRAAAWAAWAVWTCKPAGASGTPHATIGFGLKRAGLIGPLFFYVPDQPGGCRRIQPLPSGS
jgi:hypothetical protein